MVVRTVAAMTENPNRIPAEDCSWSMKVISGRFSNYLESTYMYPYQIMHDWFWTPLNIQTVGDADELGPVWLLYTPKEGKYERRSTLHSRSIGVHTRHLVIKSDG
jgi:hypothetical protein